MAFGAQLLAQALKLRRLALLRLELIKLGAPFGVEVMPGACDHVVGESEVHGKFDRVRPADLVDEEPKSDLGISSVAYGGCSHLRVLESELFDGVVVRCGHDLGVALRQALKKATGDGAARSRLCAACDLVDHDERALLVATSRARCSDSR